MLPDNSNGNWDFGWVGNNSKGTEHATGLVVNIEMGARIYNPTLGRFLSVDPIEGGTTTNDYGYVPDVINTFDLDGASAGGGSGGGAGAMGYCLTLRGKAMAACQARFSPIEAHNSRCPGWLVTTSDFVGVHSVVTDFVSVIRKPSRRGVANNVFNYFQSTTLFALKQGLPAAARTVSVVGIFASIVRGVCAL